MTGNDQQPRSIVDRVKNILLQPAREWEVIDGEALVEDLFDNAFDVDLVGLEDVEIDHVARGGNV